MCEPATMQCRRPSLEMYTLPHRRESKSLWRSTALCAFTVTTACALRSTPVGVSTEIPTDLAPKNWSMTSESPRVEPTLEDACARPVTRKNRSSGS